MTLAAPKMPSNLCGKDRPRVSGTVIKCFFASATCSTHTKRHGPVNLCNTSDQELAQPSRLTLLLTGWRTVHEGVHIPNENSVSSSCKQNGSNSPLSVQHLQLPWLWQFPRLPCPSHLQ